ncbi:MAG: SDR family oxidoreductase [Novosphingobium sp.]|nr:SDR family oxidoreductase [Novosphingobium sp.]
MTTTFPFPRSLRTLLFAGRHRICIQSKVQSEFEIMNNPLDGKVAFVTGGSKGIGRAICIGLAEAGAAVALTGRSDGTGPGTAQATAAEIAADGGRALALTCDVRDAAAVRRAIDTAAATFGRLDILMNNAGLFFPGHDVIDIDMSQWEETIQTHINGTFHCARFAARHMVAGGGGSIINMSSTGGDPRYDSMGNVAYAVAKAGIEQFTRGLSRELAAANIAVNAIRPMALLSEGSKDNADWLTRYRAKTRGRTVRDDLSDEERMKQFAPPSSIVPSIVYLAQRRADFTGNVVRRTDFKGDRFDPLVWNTTA